MSKELEVLDELVYSGQENPIIISFDITKFFQVINEIRKALQRLESIDNANPSEAMRCLEELGEIETDDINNQDICLKDDEDFKDYYNTIKNYILKAQKQEKEEK